MLQIIKAEEFNMNNSVFYEYEVEYNLVHKIIEDKNAFIIQSSDKNILAVQNEGRSMWIWINPNSEEEYIDKIIAELYEVIKVRQIPSITGYRNFINKFAETVSIKKSFDYRLDMGMIAYHCAEVTQHKYKDRGKMIMSNENHIDVIAGFLKGFIKDGFGKEVTLESQVEGAKGLITSGNLYLLEVDNRIVSMANIAHRSKRHGRINAVYTPDKERNNGYASILVAKLSLKLLEEGLTPMLYTDDSNDISNKVYTNIGYTETGRVDCIRFIDREN